MPEGARRADGARPDGHRDLGLRARARDRRAEGALAHQQLLDALEAGVNVVENDPKVLTVGYGGMPNEDGVVQLDAAIMDGRTHRAGAVGAIERIKNPISVARKVMERTEHVLLVGAGANAFAKKCGFVGGGSAHARVARRVAEAQDQLLADGRRASRHRLLHRHRRARRSGDRGLDQRPAVEARGPGRRLAHHRRRQLRRQRGRRRLRHRRRRADLADLRLVRHRRAHARRRRARRRRARRC